MAADPFNLERFVAAQSPVWTEVCEELRQGRKRTHWMWFVFPQLKSLGRSETARFYGLANADEARAYLAHPLLRQRLLACCDSLLALEGMAAREILGEVDAVKLRSCLTLFDAVAPEEPRFHACLLRYFDGERDSLTLSALDN